MDNDGLIIVDLFAGAGGAAEGFDQAAAAMGVKIKSHYAVNHWKAAIDTFKANHPNAITKRAPVSHVNPIEFVKEGYCDILIAAPECIFHSAARGGKPVDDQRRSTAWGVVDWAEKLLPKQILMENVPEFKKWGPLHRCEHYKLVTKKVSGKIRKVVSCKKHGEKCLHNKPIKERKGEIFEQYLNAFRTLGYKIEQRELVAANYGGATTRKRLFIIMTLGDQILWPEQTHNEDGTNGLQKWREAREVIDWSLEGQSIFNRKRPLAPATLRRIFAGLERYGGPMVQPFLVIMRQHMEGKPIDGPVPTIAANGNHIGLAEPFILSHASNGAARPVSQPTPTVVGAASMQLTEAAVILHTTHGSDTSRRERSASDPLPTVTGANRGELAVAEAFVLSQASGGAARPVSEPVPTICTDGAHQLVDAVLVEYHSEKRAEEARVRSLDEPLPTQTTENRFGIAAPFVIPPRHMNDGAVDSIKRPIRTITAAAGHTFGLAEAVIASYYGTLNVSPVSDPVPTVTTKERFGLVQPVINGFTLDIRFRMLQPHELAAAMDFPKNYKFKGRTKGDAVKMIGNAWDVQQGKVLCLALLQNHNQRWRTAA